MIERMNRMLCLLCVGATLGACTLMPEQAEPKTQPNIPSEPVAQTSPEALRGELLTTQTLLNYAGSLRSRNSAELAAELELLNHAYALNHTEENRLKLALYHAVAPAGDRARALALLDIAPSEANGRGRQHPFALMLLPLLQEARKQDELNASAQQRLRDEQRKSEALQQKLDALRDIEKTMLDRPARKK